MKSKLLFAVIMFSMLSCNSRMPNNDNSLHGQWMVDSVSFTKGQTTMTDSDDFMMFCCDGRFVHKNSRFIVDYGTWDISDKILTMNYETTSLGTVSCDIEMSNNDTQMRLNYLSDSISIHLTKH